VPDEVGSLQFDDVSDRAVKVIWTEPKQTNGVLTGYQLTYVAKDRPETLKVENLTSDAASVRVTHLQVWSQVHAAGHSSFCKCVRVTNRMQKSPVVCRCKRSHAAGYLEAVTPDSCTLK
jgi:hypothetical protein